MTISTLLQGVRAIAPTNYLGAPRVVFAPEDGTGDAEELSLDEAAARYAAVETEAVSDDDATEDAPDDSDTTDDLLEPEGEGEGEGEPGDEDQVEEEDETETEPGKGRFVADNAKVRLDDGTVVLVRDLKKGSLLNADYTRKTQEVAEQRRSVESQSSQLKQLETQLGEQREFVANLIQSVLPQEPDPLLAQTDPYAYTTQKATYDTWQRYLERLNGDKAAAQQRAEQEAAKAKSDKANAEWAKLLEKMPALKDETRLKSFVTDIREHGSKYGFTIEELGAALSSDARQAEVLRDAIAWRKLQASKPKVQSKVEGRPPVQKGGKRLSPDGQKARSQSVAMTRLQQSGSVNDAVAAYLALQKG